MEGPATDDAAVDPHRGARATRVNARATAARRADDVLAGMLPDILFGLAAVVVVASLRRLDILVGAPAPALLLVAIAVGPGPSRVADRFLVAATAALGWAPLLGWVPRLGTVVDVPGVILAATVGVAAGHRLRRYRTTPHTTIRRISPVDVLALATGAVVAAWWWWPLGRFDLARRFAAITRGWDHSAHFHLFLSNVRLGSFVTVSPDAGNDAEILGWDYPQGVHHAWSQWARLWDPAGPADLRTALDVYMVLVVVTAGLAVAIASCGVARVCRRSVIAALPAMTAVVQLVAFGLLSTAVWAGFSNFGIAVVAIGTAPALLMRPNLTPGMTFFVVAGLVLVAGYNWYPIALLGGMVLAVAVCRMWATSRDRAGRRRTVVAVLVVGAALAAPIAFTLHLGTDVLVASGGVPQAPRTLFAVSTLVLVAAVVARTRAFGGRPASLVLASLSVLGAASVVGLVAYQVSSTGKVLYYAEKLATGVAGACVIALALVAAEAVGRAREQPAASAKGKAAPVAMSVLASLAIVQMTGYVGPSWERVAHDDTALGFHVHRGWMSADIPGEAVAELLTTAEAVREIATRAEDTATWSYLDIDNVEPVPDLTDIWFGALVGNLDTVHIRRALALGALNQPDRRDLGEAADALERIYERIAVPNLRLVGPEPLIEELVRRGAPWTTPGLLWTRSADGVRPRTTTR